MPPKEPIYYVYILSPLTGMRRYVQIDRYNSIIYLADVNSATIFNALEAADIMKNIVAYQPYLLEIKH